MITKYQIKITFFALSLATFMATSVNAQAEQSFYAEYKAWGVFTTDQDNQKVCYITSRPTKKSGNYRKRSEPYMLVTYRRGGNPEVSVNSGYPYKIGADVSLRVDKQNYDFFTSSETPEMAWAKDSTSDIKVITAMKQGSGLVTKSYSKLGTYSQDTYSLAGFTKAYDKMKELCK